MPPRGTRKSPARKSPARKSPARKSRMSEFQPQDDSLQVQQLKEQLAATQAQLSQPQAQPQGDSLEVQQLKQQLAASQAQSQLAQQLSQLLPQAPSAPLKPSGPPAPLAPMQPSANSLAAQLAAGKSKLKKTTPRVYSDPSSSGQVLENASFAEIAKYVPLAEKTKDLHKAAQHILEGKTVTQKDLKSIVDLLNKLDGLPDIKKEGLKLLSPDERTVVATKCISEIMGINKGSLQKCIDDNQIFLKDLKAVEKFYEMLYPAPVQPRTLTPAPSVAPRPSPGLLSQLKGTKLRPVAPSGAPPVAPSVAPRSSGSLQSLLQSTQSKLRPVVPLRPAVEQTVAPRPSSFQSEFKNKKLNRSVQPIWVVEQEKQKEFDQNQPKLNARLNAQRAQQAQQAEDERQAQQARTWGIFGR